MKPAQALRPVRVQATASPLFDADSTDYSDGFAIEVPDSDKRSAEQWARSALEGAPAALRLFITAGWRLVLRLQLGPPHSSDHVLGWKITQRLPGETVLELRSASLTAHLVFHRDVTRLLWMTFVDYEQPMAAVIWPPVSLLHRRIVPYALRRAAARPLT